MSAKWKILHPCSTEMIKWIASLNPEQRKILELRTGIFQGYISRAAAGGPVPSSMGWVLSAYWQKPHLLSAWPSLA